MRKKKEKLASVVVSQSFLNLINEYLDGKRKLGVSECLSVKAYFDDSREMEIRCYVTENGKTQTEAELSEFGTAVAVSEDRDSFLGEWTIDHNRILYTAVVSN